MSLEGKTSQLIEYFYQGKQAEGYAGINDVLSDILALIDNIERDEALRQQNIGLLNEIKQMLGKALKAMEEKDSIRLADILQAGVLGVPQREEQEFILEECFEENLVAFQMYDKDAYERYQRWNQIERSLFVESETAEDGSWILKVNKDGTSCYLNSECCPEKQAKEWCKQFNLKNLNQVVFLFGLGNLEVFQQLRKSGKEDMKMVIYEPSIEVFDFLMHNTRISKVFFQKGTLLLVNGLNEEKLSGVLETLVDWDNEDTVITAVHPRYELLFAKEYLGYAEVIKNGRILVKQKENTKKYFSKDVVYNMAATLTCLKQTQFLEQYLGRFPENVPAIIVAAGPSLDLNIEILKQAKGKAVIIATDTAMRDLVKHQITPDFMITIDPRKPAEYLADKECQDIPLICCDTANREILMAHTGIKILHSLQPYTEGLRPRDISQGVNYGAGGSVATAAFSVCVALQFKTIILIGQDLAYRNGISHAGGRMSGEKEHGDWLVEVEDIFGNIVKTRHEWYVFLKWFEDAIATAARNVTVIDATEGGAKIQGTKIMSLAEAIESYCTSEIDCDKLVANTKLAFGKEEYQKAVAYVEKSIDDNDKIYADTKELIIKTEQLISFCKKKRYDKEYKKLIKDLAKLGERVMGRPIQEWLDFWIADKEESLGNIYSLEADSEIQSYKSALEVYKNLNIATQEIKPILAEVYAYMKTML